MTTAMTDISDHAMLQEPPSEAHGDHPWRYTAAMANLLEPRWQTRWEASGTFRAINPGEDGFDPDQPKYYVLDMFPYPSGAGLHVGHPEGYTATDIVARYKRHTGHNVLHPMGWDAFGLPAEQYAIQTGVHPAVTTRKAIDTFRAQLQRFGFSYDWAREFATIDEDYYKWTQWIWLQAYNSWYDPRRRDDQPHGGARPISELIQHLENGHAYIGPGGELMFAGDAGEIEALGGKPMGAQKWHELDDADRRGFIDDHRLAYLGEQTVNWCPKLGTVLANEEVIDGRSERGEHAVRRKPLRQWMFRITAYAERLLRDLEQVDWPDSTKTMQASWIGRSEGAEIDFALDRDLCPLTVYTTRPDTVFGATYMVIAPEHPLVDDIIANPTPETDAQALADYVCAARDRADVDRMAETKDKTGVFTGIYAINPATDERIPVWTADYVLMGYGHGAIMAVPGHDERDHAFATAFNLPIRQIIDHPDIVDIRDQAYAVDGTAMNSANDDVSINGLPTAEAKTRIIEWLEKTGLGKRTVNYRLRDWLFSRQRYWGEPFPVVYDEAGHHYPVDPANLPVTLPELADYEPVECEDPQPLLGKATDWVDTTAGEAGVSPDVLAPDTPVRRETNTMPGWAGSCWYEIRYADPNNAERFISEENERYWLGNGVDLYIGGAEHAVLHLLYARFWHKLLHDLGHVSANEPFAKLFHQGMITSFAYQRDDKTLVPIDEVDETGEEQYIERATGKPVTQVIAKMSKSLKNVINPDDIIAEYGADTFRLYEMYMGPLEASKPWNTRDIIGLFKFLQRIWRLVINEQSGALMLQPEADPDVEKHLHRMIHKVGGDIERLSFNTAIAAMFEFINAATTAGGLSHDQLERFAIALSPFAPHMAEELWARLGHEESIARAPWPRVDESLLTDDTIELPVQILGKVRSKITIAADADKETVEQAALADERIAELLEGKTVRKVIIVPGKIVNIIAN